MSRFTSLLELYSSAERDAKIELGRRMHLRDQLAAQRDALIAQRLAAGEGAIAVQLHEQYMSYWRGMQARIVHFEAEMAKADQAINEARKKLAEAHQRRITIDKLRERDAAAARVRDARREQRFQDERAAIAWTKERS